MKDSVKQRFIRQQMPNEKQCSRDDIPDSTGWHFYQCSRKATIEEDGKPWCWQHAPSSVKTRHKAAEVHYQAGVVRRMAPYNKIKRLETINTQLLEALEDGEQLLNALLVAKGFTPSVDMAEVVATLAKHRESIQAAKETA